jgi:hypothetical protein
VSNVVNLRMARKRKARADSEQVAAENRALHGRSKADKARDRLEAERATGHIDGHKLDRASPDKP